MLLLVGARLLVIKHRGSLWGIKSVENLLMVLWRYTLNGK